MLVKFQPLRCIKVQTDYEDQAEGLAEHEGEWKSTFLRSHAVAEEPVHGNHIQTGQVSLPRRE